MPPGAALALAGEPQRLAVVDAGGHGDRAASTVSGLVPRPRQSVARILDRLAGAAAVRTRGLHHEEALRVDDLALALAGRADLGLAARRRAACRCTSRTPTSRVTLTSFVAPHTASANVSPRSTRRSAPRALATATARATAEEVAEQIAERREDVLDVREARRRRRRRCRGCRRSRTDRSARADRRRTGPGTRSPLP